MAKKKKNNMYFTLDVDDAITELNSLSNLEELKRNSLYNIRIYKPMREMCLNIINTFKFYESCEESTDDLINDCLGFLYSKFPKFHGNRGKAFSYFSVACKRYLIQKSTSQKKKRYKIVSVDEMDMNKEYDEGLFFVYDYEAKDAKIYKLKLVDCIEEFINSSKKKNDVLLAKALLIIIKNPDFVDIYNKKIVYALLREMTGLKTKAITRIVKKIENTAYEKYKEFRKNE